MTGIQIGAEYVPIRPVAGIHHGAHGAARRPIAQTNQRKQRATSTGHHGERHPNPGSWLNMLHSTLA